MLNEFHACPRKFQHIKARAASGKSGLNNVDFAYGHSVGAGIASWLATKDMNAAIFNAMLAWQLPYDESIDKKKKSIWNATLAVQKFAPFFEEQMEDWNIWVLPNGRPALELAVCIDFENGFKHYVHIDAILEYAFNGKLAVYENKTSGFKSVEEALYANSSQALSYAVVVDMLKEETSFEVFYGVYSTTDREWNLLPFTKHTSLKAEWITDTRIDQSLITTYKNMEFFPKRGENCYSFMRRCEFFGACNLTSNLCELKTLPAEEQAERVDYVFTLSQILARQHERNATFDSLA